MILTISSDKIKLWVKDLYWATGKDTREEAEEEKIEILLNEKQMFETSEKLSGQETETSDEDVDDSGCTPFPIIPPGGPGAARSAKRKGFPTEMEVKAEFEPYCKHCGAKLPKGQTICHVCGKKVI